VWAGESGAGLCVHAGTPTLGLHQPTLGRSCAVAPLLLPGLTSEEKLTPLHTRAQCVWPLALPVSSASQSGVC
jgi:hypothetical protein